MSALKCVCGFLIGLVAVSGVARGEESAQAPPAIAKLTEKKFSHGQYRAAVLGKIVFRRGKKPLEPAAPLRLSFVKTDAQNALLPVDVKDGEAFILQAVPGSWQIKEIERSGRVYGIGQPFTVKEGNVVFIGLVDVVLKDEDRSAFEYEYRLDTTVDMRTFSRNPELGRLMNGFAPPSLSSGGQFSLFAPTYPVAAATLKGEKSLAIASEHGDLATVRELLASGADPDKTGADGWSPLHSALRFGHGEIAAMLLDRGASIKAANPDGWTPLMIALRYEQEALATRMIKSGAEIDHKSNDGWTPLMLAVRNNQPSNARLLLEGGAPVDDRTKSGTTALMLAAGFAGDDVVATLIERGADVRARDGDGWTILMWALRYQKRAAARRLVERGVDIHAADNEGWTALMYALRYEAQDVARLLVDKGAEVDARNQNGWTPLMFALRYNQFECAKLLAQKSKRIDDKDKDGWTALMYALRHGQPEAAALLIQRGAVFNYKTEGGWECLLTALRNDQAENARTLILKGANVNAKTDQGWTALMFAIEYGQAENAKLLLEKHADATIATADGTTALSLARKKKLFELTRLLSPDEPPFPPAAPAAAAPPAPASLPAAVAQALAFPEGTTVTTSRDCAPGLNGITLCTLTVEAAGRKADVYAALLAAMKKAGWSVDRDQKAGAEDAALPGRDDWGVLAFRRKRPEGLTTSIFTFPARAAASPGKTQLEAVYQDFPAKLKTVTYSQVVATYPPGAERCDTTIDVMGIAPNGSWNTLGVVRYKKGVAQFQCLGTKVTLQVALSAGGVQYEKGAKLTVDKALNWIKVESWD